MRVPAGHRKDAPRGQAILLPRVNVTLHTELNDLRLACRKKIPVERYFYLRVRVESAVDGLRSRVTALLVHLSIHIGVEREPGGVERGRLARAVARNPEGGEHREETWWVAACALAISPPSRPQPVPRGAHLAIRRYSRGREKSRARQRLHGALMTP